MGGMLLHVFLFIAISTVIVTISSFYTEHDDGKALRAIPRRLAVFLASCAGVAAVMLFCEHFFASVS